MKPGGRERRLEDGFDTGYAYKPLHHPLGHAFTNAVFYPDYDHLAAGNCDAWRNYAAAAIEDGGQQELLNWMCLTGALPALDRKPQETGFMDTWIFNSSKTFLIAPPN